MSSALKQRAWGRVVRRALVVLLALGVLTGAAVVGTALYLQNRLDDQVGRLDGVFDGLEDRPEKPRPDKGEGEPLNILVLGSDARPDQGVTPASWTPGSQRSDTMMVLHVAADRKSAAVVSFPRDSWVDVPGHGMSKINAAYSWGGPRLAVQTVEQLTDVRIDHVAAIDWEGFRAVVDVLGGVRVWVPQTVHDSARDVTWDRGMHDLDGKEALTYVRQRYGLQDGDLDRIKRQQYFLRALMDHVRHAFGVTNPQTSYDVLDALTEHLSVDEGLTTDKLRELMFTLTDLRSDQVDFVTAPVSGMGYEGDQSVVWLDDATGETLWDAVRDDRVGPWADEHPATRTPDVVR